MQGKPQRQKESYRQKTTTLQEVSLAELGTARNRSALARAIRGSPQLDMVINQTAGEKVIFREKESEANKRILTLQAFGAKSVSVDVAKDGLINWLRIISRIFSNFVLTIEECGVPTNPATTTSVAVGH